MRQFFKKRNREDDWLARFLTSTRQFNAASGRVNASAFMPPDDLRLSVFVITALAESAVWELGLAQVGRPSGRNIHARADLVARVIPEVGLTLERDDVPHRHAAITGWSAQKSEQKLFALELANRAKLHKRT